MEFIMDVLFTTGYGAAVVGIILFVALLFYYFDDKTPKI